MPLSKAELEELAQLEQLEKAGALNKVAPSAPVVGLTPAEAEELAQLEKMAAAADPINPIKESAKVVGNLAGRALDYPGGLLRTGVGAAVDTFVDGDIIKQEDLLQALKGNAPTTATMLERGGASEMGAVNLPLLGRVTGRGTLGLAGDLASGIVAGGALSKLANSGSGLLSQGAKVMNAPQELVSSAMNAGGKKTYQFGLRSLDNAAEQMGKGKNAVSGLLNKYGVRGSMKSVANQAGEIADDLATQQQSILAQADRAGVQVDLRAAIEPALAEANEAAMSKVKSVADVGRKTRDIIRGFVNHAEDVQSQIGDGGRAMLSPSELSQMKTSVYDMIGDDAWKDAIRTKSGSNLAKRFSGTLKEATEKAVSEVSPELGANLKATNEGLGALYSASKKFASEATKESSKRPFTAVDAMMAGAREPLMLGAKKAQETAFSTWGTTNLGQLLQNPTTQSLGSQALIGVAPGSNRGNQDQQLIDIVERIKQKYGKRN